MFHKKIVEMNLEFPYIYVKFEDNSNYRYDIREMAQEREEYKKLHNEDYFL